MKLLDGVEEKSRVLGGRSSVGYFYLIPGVRGIGKLTDEKLCSWRRTGVMMGRWL